MISLKTFLIAETKNSVISLKKKLKNKLKIAFTRTVCGINRFWIEHILAFSQLFDKEKRLNYLLKKFSDQKMWLTFSPENAVRLAKKRADIYRYLLEFCQKPLPKYPLLKESPWPFFIGFSLFTITFGAVGYSHLYKLGGFTVLCGFFLLIYSCICWWRDSIHESVYLHNHFVRQNLRLGMVLFIISEIMFFFSFFWAFFHSSLIPAIEIGCTWPPLELQPLIIKPFGIPLLNTIILIVSGASITWSHYSLDAQNYVETWQGLFMTIISAFASLSWQGYEYLHAEFGLSDGIYGSVFYMLTGFHGFHVFVGTIMPSVAIGRLWHGHFINTAYVGFECAIWYWHFVDVVWILSFILLYIWGNGY